MVTFKKIKIFLGVLCLISLLLFPFLLNISEYLSIPSHMLAFDNGKALPISQIDQYSILSDDDYIVEQNNLFYPQSSGQTELVFKKGNIPIKKTNVELIKNKKLIPGGHSIGVQLHTLGVIVVGHHLVSHSSSTTSPGEEADILVGDIILEMNNKKIKKMEDVKPIVHDAGKDNKPIDIVIKRGDKRINKEILPSFNEKKEQFQIGLYIRDSATGIGTISFYDEETSKYGALGHIISDKITKKPIEIFDGKIVRSTVTSIEKGDQGNPGEKQATFSLSDHQLGTITKNSPFGIFGKLDTSSYEKMENIQPLPIGLAHEIKKGPAQILTVVEGEKVEKFDIEIVNSTVQKHPSTKGIIIKVVDKKLLNKTGGIVQGMSGSPIIQNNKIVGAVTHVFVNDPTSGYGVHIEWMLEEAGINLYKEDTLAS